MFKSTWVWITGSIASLFIFFKSICLFSLRIRGQRATFLMETVRDEGRFFIMKEELCDDNIPKEFVAIGLLRKKLFIINVHERILKAGWASTDSVIYLTMFRWDVKKIKSFLRIEDITQHDAPVYMMSAWDNEKIGVVKPISGFCESVYGIYDIINNEVKRIVDKEADRSGIILHGPPGNGKSGLVRHFAYKYKIPVYVMSFMKELDNHSIIRMFARVIGPAIILMEDFCTFYDGRKCLLEEPKFTFDTILNSIDGTYSNSNNILYIMTGNHIDKFDFALKSRPSRFKIVTEVKNPSAEAKYEILYKNAALLAYKEYLQPIINGNYSLDVVLFVKESIEHGIHASKVVNDLVPQFKQCEDDLRQEVVELRHKKEEVKPADEGKVLTTA